jgi:hypothetical protein
MSSRDKGARAERSVAKLFQTWTGYEFTRTPSSGGLRWQRKNDTVGDLICSDDSHSRYFTFTIEVKFYKEISFQDLLLPNKSKIMEFWEQSVEEGIRSKKIPLLLMRYNGMPKDLYYVVVSAHYFQAMGDADMVNRVKNYLSCGQHKIVIFLSSDLFKSNYKTLHTSNKKYLKANGIK